MTTNESTTDVQVTVEQTATISIGGIGTVQVTTNGVSVPEALRLALRALNANEEAAGRYRAVLNGEDVEKPEETPVNHGDVVSAFPPVNNG